MSHQRRQPSIPRLPHRPDTWVTLLLSFAVVHLFFLNRQQGDRAIPPRICDIPRPTAPPVSTAWPPIAFRECARRVDNVGAGAIPPFPERANVSRRLGATCHSAAPNPSRTGHPVSVAPGSAAGLDPPGRRRCAQAFSDYI